MNGVSVAKEGAACAADGVEAIDEVDLRRLGHLGWPPAQLRGRGDGGGAVELPNEAAVGGVAGVERLVGHRRLDAIKPCAEVAGARGGEGCAGELLGVEAERAGERAVLGAGERPRHGLRREGVAQPRQVAVAAGVFVGVVLLPPRPWVGRHGERSSSSGCLSSKGGRLSFRLRLPVPVPLLPLVRAVL